MRAGKLDTLISIEQATMTRNAFGEDVPSWAEVTKAWAEKQDTGGNERWIAKQVLAETDTVFKTHYIENVTAGMRINLGGNIYDILAVLEIGRREGIAINARTQNN